MHHSYEHLTQNLYKHKQKQQVKTVVGPKRGYPPKLIDTVSRNKVNYHKCLNSLELQKSTPFTEKLKTGTS